MKIFINPGHAPGGDPDPGAVNRGMGLRECDVALSVGEKAAAYLRKVGYDVTVFQNDSLGAICRAANEWEADLFVSIHCNAAASEAARGTETWCYEAGDGEVLAMLIQQQIVDSLGTVDRGVKHSNDLYVLKHTQMPAVLVETAFISNESDGRLLDARRDEFAAAIARGVSDFYA